MSRITPIIKAVLSKNSVTVIRTGIRYINLFDSEKMKIRKLVCFGRLAPETEAALAGFRARGGEVSDGMEYLQVPERIIYRTRHRDYDSSFEPATGKIAFHPKGSFAE